MDMLSLECFIALAETGSFTKTAKKVFRTQSAVSQKIAKIEETLDKNLIHRGSSLELTADGETFLKYAKKIVSLYNEVQDRFKEPDIKGEISFGLPEDFASVFLSDVLTDFVQIHPRIMLNVECDLTLKLFEKFKSGKFDLVLVKLGQTKDFPDGLDVWSEKMEWVGHKNSYQTLLEDRQIPLVLSPEPCVYRARVIETLEKEGIQWRLSFCSQSYASTVAAVKAGLGFTVLPKNMVHPHLKTIKSDALPDLLNIHVSLLSRTKNNPAINSFQKFVMTKMNADTKFNALI